MASVSIIIPTLNEAAYLGQTLRHLHILSPAATEIIVVDGGSQDTSLTIAQAQVSQFATLRLLTAPPGRARQMNRGAAIATGDYLCFLHADTRVPDDLVMVIDQTLADPAIAAGGFVSIMAGPTQTRWDFTLHNALKTYYAPLIFRPHRFFGRGLRVLFGDQVMFCRRQDFQGCGGFDEALPIMEDVDLCLRLNRRGRIRQVNRTVRSSDRRVAKWGAPRAHLIYLMVGYLWGMGVPASRLQRFYEDIR